MRLQYRQKMKTLPNINTVAGKGKYLIKIFKIYFKFENI